MMLKAGVLVVSVAAAAARIDFPTVLSGRGLLEMTFEELPFPQGDVQHEVATAGSVVVDGRPSNIKYTPFARSGDVIDGEVYGLLTDKNGKGLKLEGEPYISNGADFTSLVPQGDYVCMITHFEAPDPGTTYLTTLLQGADGHFTAKKTRAMDWSEYDGLWVPCAGSVTPWKTHLGGEEFEPDARVLAELARDSPDGLEWQEERIASWGLLYLGLSPNTTNSEVVKHLHPYLYGYPWEAKTEANEDGCEVAHKSKHMAMGRVAIELPYVMPDKQTVYITDDGGNTMLPVFKAAKPGDLSCGELYASKVTQLNAANGGTYDVEWIKVGGYACDDDIEAKARELSFHDLMESADIAADGSCPEGYTSINAQPGGAECLKVKPGMELYASRFEFRRVAAMMGATTEWSKMEGLTYDHSRSRLYMAISEVRRSMEDNESKGEPSTEFDIGGSNDIRLPWNECGCVYSMDVDEEYMVTKIYPLVCGDKDANTDEFNTCNTENIAQPDNLAYVPGHDGLIIGEDASAAHQNDAVWYHDFETGTTTRILSTPYGSETTSPYYYPNINGFSYITAVVQHPYGESDEDRVDDPESTGVDAWVGYIGPFKARTDANYVDMDGGDQSEFLWNTWPNMMAGMYGIH